jgi:hypothetical protein
LLAALAALFLSMVISFFTVQFFIPADENPVIGGLFWLYALLAEGTLLVPLEALPSLLNLLSTRFKHGAIAGPKFAGVF